MRKGPKMIVRYTCEGCPYLRSLRREEQGQVATDRSCTHPDHTGPLFGADTPPWCTRFAYATV